MYSDYGLVRRDADGGGSYVAVHRVFYTLNDEPYAISEEPCVVHFSDQEEAAGMLEWLAGGADNGAIIDYGSLPKIKGEYGEGVIEFPRSDSIPDQNAPGSFALN